MSSNLLSGIKVIPRDKIDAGLDDSPDGKSSRKSSGRRKEKQRRSKSESSSSDEELEKIGKRRHKKKKKKWYSSEEGSSDEGSGTESSNSSYSDDDDGKRSSRKRKKKYKKKDSKSRRRRRDSSDDDESESGSDSERGSKKKKRKGKGKGSKDESEPSDLRDNLRKDAGLEWMLRPREAGERKAPALDDEAIKEPQTEEIKKANPRELNPYFRNDGNGYPDEVDGTPKTDISQLRSTSVVGDGGASWRLKALKRAEEQAAREGRRVEEVVGERWGSVSQLSIPAKARAAPSSAHLHAIKNRQKGLGEETLTSTLEKKDKDAEQNVRRDYLKDVSVRHPDMKAPKIHNSLSWGSRRNQNTPTSERGPRTSAAPITDKSREFENQHATTPESSSKSNRLENAKNVPSGNRHDTTPESKVSRTVNQTLSANQLAAKVLQLRMKAKHEEAEELQREVERMKRNTKEEPARIQEGGTSRYVIMDKSLQRRKEESDDMHLAQTIMQNKKFSVSGQADDEYDYGGNPQRKFKNKGGSIDNKSAKDTHIAKRIITQQERCQFCFENANRPKHLVLSIANFTYLMLPLQQPLVEGHCRIVTMQHESATRSVDENVWDEIRNFKKCLIMMFAQQDKGVVFLETVMGLSQQRLHCYVDCIPMPQDSARDAPLYFKQAIDDAEDEWSQHNAKKLIDTSEKGLRRSIPKDFPYFYVEFGLDKGFVHVIDDEKEFNPKMGLNVIRGMLELPDEDMYRHRDKRESVEAQMTAKRNFMQDWQPFDWTKQLD